jgi:CRISPR-associated Csx10 family RAMP protein
VNRFLIRATLQTPLVVRRQRQSQRSEGVAYFPGTLLRGAVAQLYLQQHGKADTNFRRLFLDERFCRFGPLDPAPRVFPRSAHSCKRFPGFPREGHGVVDLLVPMIQQRLGGTLGRPLRCAEPGCGHDLKPHWGFWDQAENGPVEPRRHWRRSVAAHVGIDRLTHTAAASIFYTLPVLEPEVAHDGSTPELLGWIETHDDGLELLRQLLDAEDGVVRIGHARTRGYGRVRLVLPPDGPVSPASGPAPADAQHSDVEPWLQFSRQLLQKVDSNSGDETQRFLFTITLPTGAVLLDPMLRYTLDPAGMVDWLPPLPPPRPGPLHEAPAVSVDGGVLRCVAAVAHHERLRGWNAAHGLPRHDEWMVARGSIYAYLYEGDRGGCDAILHRLVQLQREGIGARRNEGYGMVAVCDDFPLRFPPRDSI